METIVWNLQKMKRFETAINAALQNGAGQNDTITFDGHEYVLAYSKYLLQYLKSQFTFTKGCK